MDMAWLVMPGDLRTSEPAGLLRSSLAVECTSKTSRWKCVVGDTSQRRMVQAGLRGREGYGNSNNHSVQPW